MEAWRGGTYTIEYPRRLDKFQFCQFSWNDRFDNFYGTESGRECFPCVEWFEKHRYRFERDEMFRLIRASLIMFDVFGIGYACWMIANYL